MILTLKQPNAQFPPGGFSFVDERTGFKVNGYEGTPQMSAFKIKAHREGNPTLYPKTESQKFDINFIVQEIYQQRSKTMPELFKELNGTVSSSVPVINQNRSNQPIKSSLGPCTCGSDMVFPIYCQTCSGNRITGYKCTCGKERRA